MTDVIATTEGVKAAAGISVWIPAITALAGIGGALGSQWLSHHFATSRERRASEDKLARERYFLATELAFFLESYASGWISLRWCQMHQYREGTAAIPALDFSPATGDWRVLPPRIIFRLRSLEEEHREVARALVKKLEPELLPEPGHLRLRCYKIALKAFLLGARMRRLANLPDSPQMKGNTGTFLMLRRGRREWLRFRIRGRAESKTALEELLKTEEQGVIQHKTNLRGKHSQNRREGLKS